MPSGFLGFLKNRQVKLQPNVFLRGVLLEDYLDYLTVMQRMLNLFCFAYPCSSFPNSFVNFKTVQ